MAIPQPNRAPLHHVGCKIGFRPQTSGLLRLGSKLKLGQKIIHQKCGDAEWSGTWRYSYLSQQPRPNTGRTPSEDINFCGPLSFLPFSPLSSTHPKSLLLSIATIKRRLRSRSILYTHIEPGLLTFDYLGSFKMCRMETFNSSMSLSLTT